MGMLGYHKKAWCAGPASGRDMKIIGREREVISIYFRLVAHTRKG